MSQYKNNELEPRGWKIVITSDSTDEEIEESIENLLREHSNKVRMDLCFQMPSDEVKDMFNQRKVVGNEEIQ